MIWIWIIILGLIAGYRESETLIKMGKWVKEGSWIPFWEGFKFIVKVKVDSWHFMIGLFVLVFAGLLVIEFDVILIYIFNGWLRQVANIGFIWWLFFYIRNFFMHIIQPRWAYKRWWFLVPIFGGTLDDLRRK